jgi:hypothetical protein
VKKLSWAVGRLLECCVLAGVPLSEQQAQAAIDDNLRHSSDDVRAAAAAALHASARAYMTGARRALDARPVWACAEL